MKTIHYINSTALLIAIVITILDYQVGMILFLIGLGIIQPVLSLLLAIFSDTIKEPIYNLIAFYWIGIIVSLVLLKYTQFYFPLALALYFGFVTYKFQLKSSLNEK